MLVGDDVGKQPQQQQPQQQPQEEQRSHDETGNITCWICQGEATKALPLLVDHVCRCRGSLGTVHQRCINEWVLQHQKTTCPSCATAYTIVSTLGRHSTSLRRLDDDVPSVTQLLRRLKDAAVASLRSPRRDASIGIAIADTSATSTTTPREPTRTADPHLHEQHPTPPPSPEAATPLLPYPGSRLDKVLFVLMYFVFPTVRRIAWLGYLGTWKLLLMPLLYGHVYYHGLNSSDLVDSDAHSETFDRGARTETGSNANDNLMDAAHIASTYGLGLVLVVAYRGSIQAWHAWRVFLEGGGGDAAGRGGRGDGDGTTDADIDGGRVGGGGGNGADFTTVESIHATLTWLLDKVGWRGRGHGLRFLTSFLCEALVLSALAFVLGQPHSLRWMSVGAVVVAVLWRCCVAMPRVRRPTERLDETFERRMEGTHWGRMAWFVTYLCDMLAFSVLLPTVGGYVLHYALGPRLMGWPPVLQDALNSNASTACAIAYAPAMAAYVDAAPMAVSTAFHGPTLDALSSLLQPLWGTAMALVSSSWAHRAWHVVASFVCVPDDQLPSFFGVVGHWFVGTVCLMTLVRYEASVMVPLFHPGVDLFFIRSVDLSEEATEDDPDFAWRFVLSQVFDADPLRVLLDFVRVGVIESCALIGFVAFPVQAIWFLVQHVDARWYEGVPVLEDVLRALPPLRLAPPPGVEAIGGNSHIVPLPLGVYRETTVPVESAPVGIVHWTAESVGGGLGVCPLVAAPSSPSSLFADALFCAPASELPHAVAIDWYLVLCYALLFATVVACLCTFPMQRVQLTVLRPIAAALGDALGLREFLFDEDRLRAVDAFLENEHRDELIMPKVPHNRMFVRRERFFTEAETPWCLKPRLALFAVGFYIASTVLIWAFPVVAGACLAARISQTSLGFVGLSLLLPFACLNPVLFAKAVGQLLLLLLALTVGSVVQAAIAVVDVAHVLSSTDALVAETYEFLHTVERNVGRWDDGGAARDGGGADGAAVAEGVELHDDGRRRLNEEAVDVPPLWSDDDA